MGTTTTTAPLRTGQLVRVRIIDRDPDSTFPHYFERGIVDMTGHHKHTGDPLVWVILSGGLSSAVVKAEDVEPAVPTRTRRIQVSTLMRHMVIQTKDGATFEIGRVSIEYAGRGTYVYRVRTVGGPTLTLRGSQYLTIVTEW